MESLNLLDITIKYFNVIIFVMCVVFGMISFFASWIAWREIHHKRNIMRGIIAAYNITEQTVDRGKTPSGDMDLDPAIVQTVFNSLQEILNAVYGEISGKSIPPREERIRAARKPRGLKAIKRVFRRERSAEPLEQEPEVPSFVPEHRDHPGNYSHP